MAEEAGRTAIGTYLLVPPGSTSLRYAWTSPYAADADGTGGDYRLTIQKQPGLLPGPLTLTIHVPDGFRITAASDNLTVNGETATLTTTFDRDVELSLDYARAPVDHPLAVASDRPILADRTRSVPEGDVPSRWNSASSSASFAPGSG